MQAIVFTGSASPRSLWELSDTELATSCLMIAEERDSPCESALRAEAARLFHVWRETMEDTGGDSDERERRAALLSGLRKRTIQILVKLTWRP